MLITGIIVAFVTVTFHLQILITPGSEAGKSACVNRYVSNVMDIWKSHLTSYPLLFSGDVIVVLANDARYEDLRRHRNNVRIKSDAAYIALPRTADEVLEVLRVAVANNVRPTVRSGAHCYADFWSNNTDGILIDMSSMNRIYRLPPNEAHEDATIWIEPGATVEEANQAVYKQFRVWPPTGVCLDMGIGGHVLGGGYGYLARKFGILADYAYAFEIARVRADKSVQLVLVGRDSSDQNELDLYWALRGAGQQNFGVVTKIGFRNFPRPPPIVYVYEGAFNLSKRELSEKEFADILNKYTRFFSEHSSPGDEYCDIFADLMIWRNPTGGKRVTLGIRRVGEKAELVDRFLKYLGLDASNFSCDAMTTHRMGLAAGFRNDYFRDMNYVGHSAYMRSAMPSRQIQALWAHITDPYWPDNIDAWVQIRSYGCAISSVPENATAYPHRRAGIKLQYGIYWPKGENADVHMRWSRSLYGAMYGEKGPVPDDVMDGCYVSYPDADLVDAQHLYYKGNYERLKRVKKQWDPLNVFRHRHSIDLPPV